MKENTFIKNIIEKAKQKKIVLLISLVYNFVWAVCKIVFGIFTFSYFFCVSGANTLLFGFIKRIYLKNYQSNQKQKIEKSITIATLLMVSGFLFTFYMARMFFNPTIKEYGTILAITIATFSFFELGYSIYNFLKAKKSNDILLQSYRGYNLVSSLFAIVLTQVALCSMQKAQSNVFNGITGVVCGVGAIIISIYLLVKAVKESKVV